MATRYATVEDFIQAFGTHEASQLSNLDDPNLEAIDEDYLNQALQDASEEANSYLRSRYVTPLSDPPRALKRWVLDIARFLAHRYEPPEVVGKNYETALRFLREVRDGKKALDLMAETQEPINSTGAPETFALDVADAAPFSDLGGFR